nr:MAG TPA: hypothetical protein [Caudoviricetes sp.]
MCGPVAGLTRKQSRHGDQSTTPIRVHRLRKKST